MEDISVNQLAEILYVSPYHLCHEFKNATGKTIIQYLNTTRILHAQRLMLETDYNITQISREVGFSNLTHFNRTFKKITGVAPREKRNYIKNKKMELPLHDLIVKTIVPSFFIYALFTSTSVSYFSISSNQLSAGTLHLLQYSSQISPIGSVLHSSITTIFFDI